MRKSYFWVTTEHEFEVAYRWISQVVGMKSIHSYATRQGGVRDWLQKTLPQYGRDIQEVATPAFVRAAAEKERVQVPETVWEVTLS